MKSTIPRQTSSPHESSPIDRIIPSQLTTIDGPADGVSSGNVDRILYNDLVEILPLVQSLIDTQPKNSFTRRGVVTYTKTPSRKTADPMGRNTTNFKSGKSKKDEEVFLSPLKDYSLEIATEAEMATLREKLEDLQSKIVEKEELLKSAEKAKGALDDLRSQSLQKDRIIKSTEQQLSDAKIKLADKTAALEKNEWELMTAKRKSIELEEELANVASLKLFIDGLEGGGNGDYDVKPSCVLLFSNSMDETKLQKLEEARKAYLNAVAAAKGREDTESMLAASQARIYLQSFLMPS